MWKLVDAFELGYEYICSISNKGIMSPEIVIKKFPGVRQLVRRHALGSKLITIKQWITQKQ